MSKTNFDAVPFSEYIITVIFIIFLFVGC